MASCSGRSFVVDLHIQAHQAIVLLLIDGRILRLLLIVPVVLVVNAIVQLRVVVEHVLSVDFFAFVRKVEHAF